MVPALPDGQPRPGAARPRAHRQAQAGQGEPGRGAAAVPAVRGPGGAHAPAHGRRTRGRPPRRSSTRWGAEVLAGARTHRQSCSVTQRRNGRDRAPEGAASDETPDRWGAFPRLAPDQLSVLEENGERQATAPGQLLVAEGQRDRDFLVVLAGTGGGVEGPRLQRTIRVHGRGRFLDELGLLTGQLSFVSMVVREP